MLKLILLMLLIASRFNLDARATEKNEKNTKDIENLKESEFDDLIRSLERRINAKELSSREQSNNMFEEKSENNNGEENLLTSGNVRSDEPSTFQLGNINSKDQESITDSSNHNAVTSESRVPEINKNDETRVENRKQQQQEAILKEIRKNLEDLRNERTIFSDLPGYRDQLTDSEKQERYYRSLVRLQNLYHLYNQRYLDEDDPCYVDHSHKKIGPVHQYLDSSRVRHLEESRLLADRIAESAMHLADKRYADKREISQEPAPKSTTNEEDHENRMIMQTSTNQVDSITKKILNLTEKGSQDSSFDREIVALAYDFVNAACIAATGNSNKSSNLLLNDTQEKVDEYLRASLDPDADSVDQPKVRLSSSGFDFKYPHTEKVGAAATKTDSIARNKFPAVKSESPVEGKIYHFRDDNRDIRKDKKFKRSGGVWEDVNKLYNLKDYESNKFINLGANCSGYRIHDDECERLKRNLTNPTGGKSVTLMYVKNCLNDGYNVATDITNRAENLYRDGLTSLQRRAARNSPSMLAYIRDRVDEHTMQLNRESQHVFFGFKLLKEKMTSDPVGMTLKNFHEFIRYHDFHVTGTRICRVRQDRCASLTKYRTIDGSCNNFRNPSWGKTNTALARVLPASYSDQIYNMRSDLPNPRELSTRLFGRKSSRDLGLTLAFVYWGQMIDHDLARVVSDQCDDGGIECCRHDGSAVLLNKDQHYSCMSISINQNDTFYAKYNQSCMNYVRSMTVAPEDCSLQPVNQMNTVTSFLDLSPIYGSDEVTSDALREFKDGRMRTDNIGNLMPSLSSGAGSCDLHFDNQDTCFQTGDPRSNENPGLIVLQTMLVREHNIVAENLAITNPHWNDEQIFQESRRIVIAEYQHITYQHWLPLVLGNSYLRAHGIIKAKEELSRDYDEKINPSVINGFATAAFKFLHSAIHGRIYLVDDNEKVGTTRLSDHYFRPGVVNQNNLVSLLQGLTSQTMERVDLNFDKEVTEYLFRSNYNYGMDLVALDIQRGRDHGLPRYNDYRKLCELDRAESFQDLINEINLPNIQKLEQIYGNVNDIDLFVGALMETKAPGSLVGPTMQCLIGEQFYRSKFGDKYFYTHGHFPHSFTREQFEEIKKRSIAVLMCNTNEDLYDIQLNPFLVPSFKNSKLSCENLSEMDLTSWKEEKKIA